MKRAFIATLLLTAISFGASAQIVKKRLPIRKTDALIKIDGNIRETAWQNAAKADSFIEFQPTPYLPEKKGNETEVYLLYNDEGIYAGGYLHESNKDSIAKELTGRDGFGNNDFIGLVFDTYQDKLNGFEYFVTPLNEQWDSKVSSGNGEDFAWNAVWHSAVQMQADGWTFEMFIPYAAIRFSKSTVQDWGMNIVRDRRKSGQKFFWQPIDPNINGFLTQNGTLAGLENIKPPLRLQFSPYFSTYYTHDDGAPAGTKKSDVFVNGGMDVKYGINQAFTLDMTLIPDFGQVQTDNRTLNLSPFEQRFAENRSFFTEGVELFTKGNLFYSRRIGLGTKLINATKISGRTKSGLGVGILNAVTKPRYDFYYDDNNNKVEYQSEPLSNYNVFVLDQTLKNNSSISLVNTNVLRSGHTRDANVSSALFDINDKSNTWNVGGSVTVSNVFSGGITSTGYGHSVYAGKISGQFNFRIYQDLLNDKYDKSDLGYFTNNNFMENGASASYSWNKPKNWYNRLSLNASAWSNRLVTPIDFLKRKGFMNQYSGARIGGNAQFKNLWSVGFNSNRGFSGNDFYEPRSFGRVLRSRGRGGFVTWVETNSAKKLSGYADISAGRGGVFRDRSNLNYSLALKFRFSSKFSIDNSLEAGNAHNDAGWAAFSQTATTLGPDTIYFSRRNIHDVSNTINLKYNFNNAMGLSLRARHAFTKVDPQQFYTLETDGYLQPLAAAFPYNVRQNYNFLSADLIYTWQFVQGSFITLAWKDIGEDFTRSFQRNYSKNLGNIISGDQFNSFSLRVIYFIDYAAARAKMKAKKMS